MKHLKAFWFFIRPFLSIFAKKASVVLAEAAMRAVAVAESEYNGEDGVSKRDYAFAEIKRDLKAKGIELSATVIYAAIESAVSELQRQAR